MFIRNGSELPVLVQKAQLDVAGRPLEWPASFEPGTIPPGKTWGGIFEYPEHAEKSTGGFTLMPQAPMGVIQRVVLLDAAGHQWEIRPQKAGPPRRVRWWLRKRWERSGDL